MKGIWDEILGQEAKTKVRPDTSELEMGIDQLLGMRLSELSKRNIAIKIYSEVLGCEIWLCGNEEMAAQVEDAPEVIIFTVDEMRKLIKLNPSPEDLKNIHNVKATFPQSKVVNSSLTEDRVE